MRFIFLEKFNELFPSKSIICMVLVFLFNICSVCIAAEQEPGLLFYLSGENGFTADFAMGNPEPTMLNGVEIILTFTDYETNDTEIGAVYQDLVRYSKTAEALFDELTAPDPIRRVMAAAILDSRYGPVFDLTYDALNQEKSIRTQAKQLVNKRQ